MNKVLEDNILYLNEWMRYNPSLKETLKIENNKLLHNDESIDLTDIYLPEMLYNEQFRKDIPLETELNGDDLFNIIKVYHYLEEVKRKEEQQSVSSPEIINIEIKTIDNKECIIFIDENNKKYRFDTPTPEKVINMYNDLKQSRQRVSLNDIGRVIKNGTN